jgi:hypothetical protein
MSQLLRNLKAHYHGYKGLSLSSTLSYTNPLNSLALYLFNVHLPV